MRLSSVADFEDFVGWLQVTTQSREQGTKLWIKRNREAGFCLMAKGDDAALLEIDIASRERTSLCLS
jgi:hypothetical protein